MTKLHSIMKVNKAMLVSLLFSLIIANISNAQNSTVFVEYGTTVHMGRNTPLWQISNQHGLSSIKNNTYIRGGAFYKNTINSWTLEGCLDLAIAAGFTSTFIAQQAYIDVRHKWIGMWAGNRELTTELLNSQLSTGGLVWSSNARPIPQICIGVLDYVHLTPGIQIKAQVSYGWFTDGQYQKKYASKDFPYVKKTKFHHKSIYFRFGQSEKHWLFDAGIRIDDQFGGYATRGIHEGDLGNGWKDYLNALIPRNGGEGEYFDGNYLGSEHLKLTYQNKSIQLSIYLENYYDDFSGMGKQNGMDGLWGIEYKTNKRQAINNLVLEYYQSTNQSGALHGLDFSDVGKTGGADDYYNHVLYPGWSHWGMSMGNPLVASPIYNNNGNLAFQYNRVKAIHLGWSGDISNEWTYRAKLSFNRTWGTPFKPIPEILENFSTFAEFKYIPNKWKGWSFTASAAFDIGDIYGDNLGLQLKVHKKF